MPCLKNCKCVLCLELSNYEDFSPEMPFINNNNKMSQISENFILRSPPTEKFEKTKYLHDQLVSELNRKYNRSDSNNNSIETFDKCILADSRFPDSVHKSVVYISGSLKNDTFGKDSRFYDSIDDSTVLTSSESNEDKNVINVVFKNSFVSASQIIKDMNDCNVKCCDEIISDDDFPLGMEAEELNKRYME